MKASYSINLTPDNANCRELSKIIKASITSIEDGSDVEIKLQNGDKFINVAINRLGRDYLYGMFTSGETPVQLTLHSIEEVRDTLNKFKKSKLVVMEEE